MTRKPISDGFGDFIRGDGWKVRMFTPKGAQRYADKRAVKSGMSGAVGLVCECADHFIVNVAAQPYNISTGAPLGNPVRSC